MKLYSPLRSLLFFELINYFNLCASAGGELYNYDDFVKEFCKKYNLSKNGPIMTALTNNCDTTTEDNNIYLLFKNSFDEFTSILNYDDRPLSIPLTKAEKSWLNFALEDSKSSIFLNRELTNQLKESIKKSEYINISKYLKWQHNSTADVQIKLALPRIMASIYEFRPIQYNGSQYIVYKIMYNNNENSFSCILYDIESQKNTRLLILELTNEVCENLKKGSSKLDRKTYEQNWQEAQEDIKKNHSSEAIKIQCISYRNGRPTMVNDRCALLFSSYDTDAYIDENENLNMTINYYDFQENEVIENLLSLGIYVKVLSPDKIIERIKSYLPNKT